MRTSFLHITISPINYIYETYNLCEKKNTHLYSTINASNAKKFWQATVQIE